MSLALEKDDKDELFPSQFAPNNKEQ